MPGKRLNRLGATLFFLEKWRILIYSEILTIYKHKKE